MLVLSWLAVGLIRRLSPRPQQKAAVGTLLGITTSPTISRLRELRLPSRWVTKLGTRVHRAWPLNQESDEPTGARDRR
jgi:hypothetical protein